MNRFLDNIRRLFQRQPDESGDVSHSSETVRTTLDDKSVASLMMMIEQTNEGEYSCAETYELLDEYVELAAEDQDIAALMPLVKKHVDHCPDCGPRFEILLDILQNT